MRVRRYRTKKIPTYERGNRIRNIAICIVLFVTLIVAAIASKENFVTRQVITKQSDQQNLQKSLDDSKVKLAVDPRSATYRVESIVDGDTFKVVYDGKVTSVRIIGVNTPETVDPRKNVECFGREASNYLKSLLHLAEVSLVADESQTDRDKYDRLLRYVYKDGEDIGQKLIADGYAYEYTYGTPYKNQANYKAAQKVAESQGKGLWANGVCENTQQESEVGSSASTAKEQVVEQQHQQSCNIKGNINSKGEKIYHLPGQKYYAATKIDTANGERWFCSEQEALTAGWRAAKV